MSEPVNPKDFPFFSGPSLGEVQNVLGEALADVLWDDGLEHLSSIKESLASIATSLDLLTQSMIQAERADTAEKVAKKLTEKPAFVPEPTDSYYYVSGGVQTRIAVPDPENPGKFIEIDRWENP